jgi:O-acetylhomoserine/O-acetylserine sulfhydrylase-like pyridoxal-dependent enzyme
MKKHEFRQETEAVRGGTSLHKKNGPLATPIYQTSTFEVTDNQEQLRATDTDRFYTRYGNPTHTVVENAVAELEGTDAALLFFGDGGDYNFILTLVKAGDHIVAQRDIYGGVTKSSRSGCRSWASKLLLSTPTKSSSTRRRSGRTQRLFISSRPPIRWRSSWTSRKLRRSEKSMG